MNERKKNGFISSVVMYSFFIVFILLLIAALLTYVNKQRLLAKLKPEQHFDYPSICKGHTLKDCLLMTYYEDELNTSEKLEENIDTIKSAINKQQLSLTSNNVTGLYKASDENGKNSYFYRGDIDNNYVSFAGLTWRVIRINGTDNVRLILTDVDNETIKNTLTNKANVTYSEKRGLITCGDMHSYVSGSLITNFNNSNSHSACLNTDKKYNIGLMYGKSSLNKDEIYGNLNNSTILNVLYNFYDTYLKEYEAYISNDDYYCSNKNPISDDEKDTSAEFESIVKDVCQKSGWEWACENSFLNSLSYANYKQIYYEELLNIMKYTNGSTPTYICGESGKTASNKCNKANNLSTYSANNSDKIKYNISSNDCKIDSFLKSNKSSFIFNDDINYSTTIGNGSLTRPIGLISATEAYLAGSNFSGDYTNVSSVSSDVFTSYWTSSAATSDLTSNVFQEGKNFGVDQDYYFNDIYTWEGNYYFAVNDENNLKFTLGYSLTDNGPTNTPYARPVINLKSSVVYCSGMGTKEEPYKIALAQNACENNE